MENEIKLRIQIANEEIENAHSDELRAYAKGKFDAYSTILEMVQKQKEAESEAIQYVKDATLTEEWRLQETTKEGLVRWAIHHRDLARDIATRLK